MKNLGYLVVAAALVTTMGCKGEIDGKPAATVSDPTPTTAAQKPAEDTAKPDTAKPDAAAVPFDLANSKVEWHAGKMLGDETEGKFEKFEGTVTLGADGKIAAVTAMVDTTSVVTDKAKLTKHLKSPDFFSAAEFPKATFTSSKIEHAADGAMKVTGLLDLRGVKKEISFPATAREEGGNVIATAEFTLMRFDFGIAYKGKADNLIKNEVLMKLQVAAPKGS